MVGRSAKRKQGRLLELSYDPGADVTDADALEKRWIKRRPQCGLGLIMKQTQFDSISTYFG